MRYTTIIDITEYPVVYKNHNVQLVYLYLCLKSGYHDHDRDLIEISIRGLAANVRLSIAATRHALDVLQRYKLLSRQGSLWLVKKWVVQESISARPKTARQQRAAENEARRQMEREAAERQEQVERIKREQQYASGRTPFMIWYEQKLKEAEAGDPDALRSVNSNKAMYEVHCAEIKNLDQKNINQ